MKKYFAEMQLDSGSIRVEFEGPDEMDDDDAGDRATAEIKRQLKYAKLDCWGEP
jgi:hypothetical protein